MSEAATPTPAQNRWAMAAAVLFLAAIALLGYALSSGIMLTFAVGWVVLQIFGYVGAIKIAKGDTAHPLFISQVMLHAIGAVLLITLITRAAQ